MSSAAFGAQTGGAPTGVRGGPGVCACRGVRICRDGPVTCDGMGRVTTSHIPSHVHVTGPVFGSRGGPNTTCDATRLRSQVRSQILETN
jgi:hypothetical protein